MTNSRRTPAGEALTGLILELFRLNGRLLAAGDRLVAPLGMTSARWQVLGAAALAAAPETVARLARAMGLNRQGVQRIVNELEAEGFVELRPNPHHARAKLVGLTARGRATFAAADRLQAPWVNALAQGRGAAALSAAAALLRDLRERLERQPERARR